MQNVAIKREGSKLVITVDTATVIGPSKSGKSVLVASTGGNQTVTEDGLILGLTAYRTAPAA